MKDKRHKGKRIFRTLLILVLLALVILVAVVAFRLLTNKSLMGPSNPWKADTVGEIPVPRGYTRVEAPKGSYAAYLRSLPLKPKGSSVHLYTGGIARLQFLSAAVIDLPLLSNYEQCADATMRIRAEYLYRTGRYGSICFTDVNGNKLRYQGGKSRAAFENYMRKVYGVCSTFSLYRETKPCAISDVRPGDVLVYPAREGRKYGHAVLVVDVAKNKRGRVAVMCLEGNTPARDLHIIRNQASWRHNPWFVLDEGDENIWISVFRFGSEELRRYS